MNNDEKVSNKTDSKIQQLRNEKMKIFEEYEKERKELYNKKYSERIQTIYNKINELQYKKEADQA